MLRLDHVEPALRGEPLGEAVGELGRHVLHDQDRRLLPGRRAAAPARPGRAGRRSRRRWRRSWRARPGSANSACMCAPRAGRASTGIRRIVGAPHRAQRAEQALARTGRWPARSDPPPSATRSTAPSSSARMAARGARPRVRAHHHDRPRRLRHDVADRAEAIELGHLQVHQDQVGLEVVHLLQRLHAVPRRCRRRGSRRSRPPRRVSSRRKKALSSTTRTRRAAQRLWTPCATERDLDPPVRHPELHRAAEVAAGRLADERPRRAGGAPAGRRRCSARPSGSCPARRAPANMLAPPTSRAVIRRALAPCWPMSSSRRGIAVCGNLAGLSSFRLSAGDGSSTCARPPTCATGSYSTMATQLPEADRHQHVVARAGPEVGDAHDDLAASRGPPVHALARVDERQAIAGRAEQGLHLAEDQDILRARAHRRTSGTAAPASGDRSRSRRSGRE